MSGLLPHAAIVGVVGHCDARAGRQPVEGRLVLVVPRGGHVTLGGCYSGLSAKTPLTSVYSRIDGPLQPSDSGNFRSTDRARTRLLSELFLGPHFCTGRVFPLP